MSAMLQQMVAAEGMSNPAKGANDVCFRRCVTHFKHEPHLELGEKSCVSRCAQKFFEAYNVVWERRDMLNDQIRKGKYDVMRITGTDEELQQLIAQR